MSDESAESPKPRAESYKERRKREIAEEKARRDAQQPPLSLESEQQGAPTPPPDPETAKIVFPEPVPDPEPDAPPSPPPKRTRNGGFRKPNDNALHRRSEERKLKRMEEQQLERLAKARAQRALEQLEKTPQEIELAQRKANEAKERAMAREKAKIEEQDAEMARRVLARRRLIEFTKRFHPAYEAGFVHRDVCRRLEKFLQDVVEQKAPRLMLFMPPRHGKLILDTEELLTYDKGFIQHGELTVGDKVIGLNGGPVTVLAVSEPAEADYLVRVSDGSTVQTHGNHEWQVWSRWTRRWVNVETRFLFEEAQRGRLDYITPSVGKRRFMYQLPLETAPVQHPTQDLPVHPYMLGIWLGDGSKHYDRICFDPRNDVHIRHLASKDVGYVETNRHAHGQYQNVAYAYFGQGQLKPPLRALGVLHNKHIPEVYLRSSVEQRLQLLAGLIDSDGNVDKKGRVRFSNTNERLIEGVMDLLRGLGMRPYRMETSGGSATSLGKANSPVWQVGFQPHILIPTVRNKINRLVTPRKLSIAGVERVKGGPGRCIQVDALDGLYRVGRTHIPTHNSQLASINFPAWALGHHPELEIISSSYAVSLPIGFSRKVRELIQDPAYKALFPKTQLDKNIASAETWATTMGGGFIASGVGTGITGKGYHIGIIDDPIKDAEEADSETIREKAWDWFSSTFYTRAAPGAGILVILTRWHDDDLAGRLLAQMKQEIEEGVDPEPWEVIQYPAVATTDEYVNADGTITDAPKAEGSIQVRRKGEALHEERFPLARLERIKRTLQPRHFSALYQQNPVPDEGSYFTKDMFRFNSQPPPIHTLRMFAAWDLAIGEKQVNDWTVGVIGGLDYQDQLFVVDVLRFRGDSYKIAEAIVSSANRWQVELVGIEKGQLEQAIRPTLLKMMREKRATFALAEGDKALVPVTDKLSRARPLQGRLQQGMIYFDNSQPWCEKLIEEALRFPAGVHDDQVDSLAWLVRLVMREDPPKPPRRQTAKTLQSRLQAIINDVGQLTPMAA